MNTEQFTTAYHASRNGCDHFIRHPLVRSFAYSDGVASCADAGCYWLIDILATELPIEFKLNAKLSHSCSVKVTVKDSKAILTGEFVDGIVGWCKDVEWTDLPEGEWIFYITDECEGDTRYRCILLTEY